MLWYDAESPAENPYNSTREPRHTSRLPLRIVPTSPEPRRCDSSASPTVSARSDENCRLCASRRLPAGGGEICPRRGDRDRNFDFCTLFSPFPAPPAGCRRCPRRISAGQRLAPAESPTEAVRKSENPCPYLGRCFLHHRGSAHSRRYPPLRSRSRDRLSLHNPAPLVRMNAVQYRTKSWNRKNPTGYLLRLLRRHRCRSRRRRSSSQRRSSR